MRAALILLAIAAAAACSRAGEEVEGKRSPAAPPPGEVSVPADLRIEVTVDGVAQPPLDADALGRHRPDFSDQDRQAWRMTTLIPAFAQPGASIEARGRQGVGVRFERSDAAGGLEPVLFLTRRGELVATVVDPERPFPAYHGQGGRLRRPGDRMPHVSPVLSLAVSTH